jgi:phosphoribosylglycinamide formyltransferase-1
VRLAVLVSGEGSNLQALLDTVHGRDGIEVACVAASRPGTRALQRAERASLPTAVFSVAGHADRGVRDRALAGWIESHGVELVVLAGFMELLSPDFIRRFRGRIVNVHPSLLPAFPGPHAIEQALAHGVRVIGVTVHFVDEGVDSGPIILQEAIALPYGGRIEAIEDSVHAVEHRLLPRAVRLIARGAVRADLEAGVVSIEEGLDEGR